MAQHAVTWGRNMQNAEAVTFGGGGLDRAAHLRGRATEIAHHLAEPTATAIAVRRGKPLLAGGDSTRLVQLSVKSELLRLASDDPVFLGLGEKGAVFAFDVSAWQPEASPDTLDSLIDASELRHPDLPADHRFADLRVNMAGLSPLDAELAATSKSILGWHKAHGFCAKCGTRSKITMSGWQRDCAACGTRHFPRVEPVVIMLITHGNTVLLGRSPDWPERMFSLLAGFVEPGETIEAAVRREVLEEAGIRVGPVRYLASQPWAFPSSLMIGCQGEAENLDITIDPNEIDTALWLRREDLMDVFAGLNEEILPARPGSIAHFLLQNWLADRLD